MPPPTDKKGRLRRRSRPPSIDLGNEKFGYDFELVDYRNYLVDIWKEIRLDSTRLERDSDIALKDLKNRFHQDFATTETAKRFTNEILIPILMKILTSPIDEGHGFGIPLASIKKRGPRTTQEYLNYLIGLTWLSSQELSLRYRINLQRPDNSMSSEVEENIATLQAFFCDSFQSDLEPYPIIPTKYQYKAPFFLGYEEWLHKRQIFFPENFYDIRKAVDFKNWKSDMGREYDYIKELRLGHDAFYKSEYAEALNHYGQAVEHILNSLHFVPGTGGKPPLGQSVERGRNELKDIAKKAFSGRQRYPIKNIQDLDHFIEYFKNTIDSSEDLRADYYIIYLMTWALPVLFGDVFLAMGEYQKAIQYYLRTVNPRILMGMADESDDGPYYSRYEPSPFFFFGNLPYTFHANKGEGISRPSADPTFISADRVEMEPYYWENWLGIVAGNHTHQMEDKFFKLRLANAMLEWADFLYRTDYSSNLMRARELYKAVLYLYGESPPIDPKWPVKDPDTLAETAEPLVSWISFHVPDAENPAVKSQKSRARKGFIQLEMGLNYYGYSEDMVPTLRYRTLKDAADSFTASAKDVQNDLLNYLEKIDEVKKERILTSNILKKAVLEEKIAVEQERIAEIGVSQAQENVEEVKKAIQAKEKEIEDHEDFFSQFKDYISGFKEAIDTSFLASSQEGIAKEGIGSGGEGVAGGAYMMGAFALFVYGSYVSMGSMADAANRRRSELSTLREKVLPHAQELVVIKQREIKLANLHGEIAQADTDLAKSLIYFQSSRLLNIDFMYNLASLSKRIMRRFLDIGGNNAWLAERALSYEQDRSIDIIRLDYFPVPIQGITGADLLRLDLAELEASRIAGFKKSLQIKHTFSMMNDFPLAFGQLKKTGKSSFKTEELPFRYAYPGTYGYRIRNISVMVEYSAARPPIRGLLTNHGASVVSSSDGISHVYMTSPEAVPVSNFQLQNDMSVFALPDDTLLAFEGRGIETFWTLEFPSVANPYGLDSVSDITLTFYAQAHYSTSLYLEHLALMPSSINRLVLVSALKYQSKKINDLRKDGTDIVNIDFSVDYIGLPKKETNRKITNLIMFMTGYKSPDKVVTTTFKSNTPRTDRVILFSEGIASSNASILPTDPAPVIRMPLNDFVGMKVEQVFTLTIKKSKNPGIDFSRVGDIILGVEYAADIMR